MKQLISVACLSLAVVGLDAPQAFAWGCCGTVKTKSCQYNAFSPFCANAACVPCGCCGFNHCFRTTCIPMGYCPTPGYGGCAEGAYMGGSCAVLPNTEGTPVAAPTVPAAPAATAPAPLPPGTPTAQGLPAAPAPYPILQPTGFQRGYYPMPYAAPGYAPMMPYGQPYGY
jgi:hypothetical protein